MTNTIPLDNSAQNNPDIREWKSIIAGTLLTACGLAVYMLMPLHIGAMMSKLSLTTAQAGLLSGSEYYAIGIASLFGPLWIHRFNWQKVALFAATMACVGHIATILLDNFALIVIARIFTGLFGEGILYAISFAVLAETRNPDRSFGIAIAVSSLIAAIAVWNSSLLLELFGRNSMVVALLSITITLFTVIKFTPMGSKKTPHCIPNTNTNPRYRPWIPITGLTVLTLWFVGPGGFWTFGERIADSQGISNTEISTVFALTAGLATLGPLLAAGIGERLGRIWPVVLPSIIMTLAVWAFSSNIISHAFMPSLITFSILMGVSSVYLFGLIAIIDTTGRLNVLIPAFQSIGEGTGPLIMGILVGSYGYAAVGWSYAVFTTIALLMFFPVVIRVRKTNSARNGALDTQ